MASTGMIQEVGSFAGVGSV